MNAAKRIAASLVTLLLVGWFSPVWAQQDKALIVAAAHWGTFKLTDEPMDEPPRRMREEWQASGLDGKDLWIMRHGETRVLR